MKDLHTFAFADDMALGTKSFQALHQAMELIDEFRTASGLGINIEKTTVMAAKGSLQELAALATASPWGSLKVVRSHVYLGILIGRGISVEDIYANALLSFETRASSYLPVARKLPHASRVMVFNTFLLSKLTYIMEFYSLPYGSGHLSAVAVVERVAARLVINFRNAYSYTHLIQHKDRLGPSPPLRDGWTVSISTLAAKADPSHLDMATDVERIPGAHNSLLIKTHIEASLVDFVSWHLHGCDLLNVPRCFVAADFFKGDLAATRRALAKRLARVAYQTEQDASTSRALERRGVPSDQFSVDCIHAHFALLPTGLPPRFRKNQFLLTFNALATGKRRMVVDFPDSATRHALPVPPCPFCPSGEDSATHFFDGSCQVIVAARRLFGLLAGVCLVPEVIIDLSGVPTSKAHCPSVLPLTQPEAGATSQAAPPLAAEPSHRPMEDLDDGSVSAPSPSPFNLPPGHPPADSPGAAVARPARKRRRRRRATSFSLRKRRIRGLTRPPRSPPFALPTEVGVSSPVPKYDNSCSSRISPSFAFCCNPLCHSSRSEGLLFKLTSYLTFGPSTTTVTSAIVIFNSSVWSDRCNFFLSVGAQDKLDPEQAALRLARTAALAFASAMSPTPKGFGRAGQRTRTQAASALAFAEHRLSAVPEGEVIAFTDGASRGNPGPSGSGTSLYVKGAGAPSLDHSIFLGTNTNNFAELWAVGVSLSLLTLLPALNRPYSLHVFTDSEYTIGCLVGGFVSHTNRPLVRAIRKLRASLIANGTLSKLNFAWVPGHAGLEGNTLADFLANRGAEGGARGQRPIDFDTSYSRLSFIPDRSP